jgi:hypothetical protein
MWSMDASDEAKQLQCFDWLKERGSKRALQSLEKTQLIAGQS